MFKLLAFIICFLLPYDSFPLPISGASRPISFIFILIYIFFYILNSLSRRGFSLNVSRHEMIYISFFACLLIWSICASTLIWPYVIKDTNSFGNMIKGFSALSVSVGSFYFGSKFLHNMQRLNLLIKFLVYSTIFPLCFGLVHIFDLIFSIDIIHNYLTLISSLFVLKVDGSDGLIDRISLLTLEPAWAAQQILCFYFPILLLGLMYGGVNKLICKILFFMSFVALMFTGSGFIILWCIVAFVFYFCVDKNMSKSLSRYLRGWHIYVLTILFVILAIFSYINGFFSYQFFKLNSLINDGLAGEASSAIRLYNPKIAFDVFWGENAFLGIGMSMFGFFVPSYGPEWYSLIGEGAAMMSATDPYLGSPRSMYARILVEFGIPGIMILIFSCRYLYKLYISSKYQINDVTALSFFLFFVGMLSTFFVYDSFANCYIPIIISIYIKLFSFSNLKSISKT